MRIVHKRIFTVVMTAALLLTSGVSFALPAYPEKTLSLGDYGDEVSAIQTELRSVGLYFGDITGLYDENTHAAVAALQTILGLSPDGDFGAATYEAYIKALEDQLLFPMDTASSQSVSVRMLEGKIIGLDPGHQSTADIALERTSPVSKLFKFRMSAGATGAKTGTAESLINLLIAIKLKDMLTEAGATVIMTRTEQEVFLSNAERASIMNKAGVEFWVRLHCDASSDAKLSGACVLIPAASESPNIYDQSLALGVSVLDAFCASTGANNLSVASLSNQTGFNWSQSPVVTIEMGYLSNPCDDVHLNRDAYQSACAKGVFDGILTYYLAKEAVDGAA
jgi:N-acetylmuramoyl-L-alanine amidase